jgi:NADPH-dependent 2,4-dienoyl-CoA reductase/sulfur reductase-like enzyme
MTKDVIIVGASIAGVGVANELRQCGFQGGITLLDSQPHLPYDRPPLSKTALLEVEESIILHPEDHYRKNAIDLKLGVEVESLDGAAREIRLKDGQRLTADAIVVATGARARPFPGSVPQDDVWTIRDLNDAACLKKRFESCSSVAVVGGGFIGAEVASSARKRGLAVMIVEIANQPFERLLGPEVAARLVGFHRQAGIEVLCQVAATGISRRATGGCDLTLSDGRQISADVVVVGMGSLPNHEWLAESGVATGNGVLCDAFGLTSVPGIYAAGDVAAWSDSKTGRHVRHEHWTSAREQGRIVAQHIAGQLPSAWSEFVPYFWSDMHGKRLQVLGDTEGADAVRFVFTNDEKQSFVAEYGRRGVLVGVAGCNAAGKTMQYLRKLPEAPQF